MKWQRLLGYDLPNKVVAFEAYFETNQEERFQACYEKFHSLMKAYFGRIADMDSRHQELLVPADRGGEPGRGIQVPSRKDNAVCVFQPPVYGRVSGTVMVFLTQVVRDKCGLDTEHEAEGVLKRLFGVANLKEAKRQKAVDVLEKILTGQA